MAKIFFALKKLVFVGMENFAVLPDIVDIWCRAGKIFSLSYSSPQHGRYISSHRPASSIQRTCTPTRRRSGASLQAHEATAVGTDTEAKGRERNAPDTHSVGGDLANVNPRFLKANWPKANFAGTCMFRCYAPAPGMFCFSCHQFSFVLATVYTLVYNVFFFPIFRTPKLFWLLNPSFWT